MKIFYPVFVRLPTEKAHGAQIVKTCEAFADVGVDVELVVPGRRTHVDEDIYTYYGAKKNFTLTARKTPDFTSWGQVGFGASMLLFAELVSWKKSFWKADIIYSRDAFLLLQYILLGRKMVYEAHTKPTHISTFVAKRAYKVVVISEGLKDIYIVAGVPVEKIIVAHDAVDPEAFQKKYSQKESRDWLGIPQNKNVALYVGKIDEAKGAETFAAASENVSEEILCVLIGPDSPQKKAWQEKYAKALFLPETPYRDLPRVLAAGDVLVLPNSAKDEDASKYTSPLKAFAYLASGKPIVASDVQALKTILKDEAVFFSNQNPQSLAKALCSFKKSDVQRLVYSWDQRVRDIVEALK